MSSAQTGKTCHFMGYWTYADELICNIVTWGAVLLENTAFRLKRMVQRRALFKFIDYYSLKDARQGRFQHNYCNPYQCIDIILLMKLIRSGEIGIDDVIMDVGSGTGLFLLYLASKGFHNLVGVEYNDDLYEICMKNISVYTRQNTCKVSNFRIYKGDALETPVDDDITVFYLFNPFCHRTAYHKWFNLVRASIKRCNRKIKILLLRPTSASEHAIRDCEWLKEKRRIYYNEQLLHQIMYFEVFENHP